MSTKLLTNLLFEPKGVHDPALTYSIKDTVMSPDGSKVYFALRDVPSGIALTDEDYWMLQIDLSGSKNAMDEAVAAFADYAKIVGTRVKGETAKASGNPVSFLPDAGSLLQPVTVLEPQQQGSGDPSPENVRPFIGYDKLDLNHAGKNLLPTPDYTAQDFGLTWECSNNLWHVYGTTTAVYPRIRLPMQITLPAGNFVVIPIFVSGSMTDAAGRIALTDNNTTKYIVNSLSAVRERTTFERMIFGNVPVGTTIDIKFYLMLNADVAEAEYAPYAGTPHIVQLGQTVYGIRYDWLTGKGWIEWIVKNIVSAADIVSSYENIDGTALICVIATDAIAYAADVLSDVLSSHFAAVTSNDQYLANGNSVSSSGGNVAITVKNVNSIEDMDVLLAAQNAAGTPVQVAYKLATPIEIQLTPHVISAVEPEQNNTLYGDGSIEVEYVKPLHVSIEERVAAIASAMLMKEE